MMILVFARQAHGVRDPLELQQAAPVVRQSLDTPGKADHCNAGQHLAATLIASPW
jgi:hypothetical protein